MSNHSFSGRKPYDPTLFGGLDAILMNQADPSDRFLSRVNEHAFADVLEPGVKKALSYEPRRPGLIG